MCDSLATTGDHVPPQSLFTTTLRSKKNYKPLKVPACYKHNNFSKKDEEYVRLVLAAGGVDNPYAEKLFDERIIPRAKKDGNKLLTTLIRQTQPTLVRHSSGIFTPAYKFEISKPRLQNVVNKIAHGLYWHHNGYRIPDLYVVGRYCFNRQPAEDQIKTLHAFPVLSLGHPSVFEYRYAEVGNDENSVYIAMMIFRKLFIEVTILTKDLLDSLLNNKK